MSNNNSKHYDTQPAPSGHPTVPDAVKPHRYGEKPTSEKGERKQLCIDLGVELGRYIYKELKTNDTYHKKHRLDFNEIGVLLDFMYGECFRLLYEDKYPHDPTYQQPTSATNRTGRVGGRMTNTK